MDGCARMNVLKRELKLTVVYLITLFVLEGEREGAHRTKQKYFYIGRKLP